MANLSSIARPYALAAFKEAQEKQTLASWNAFLGSAATVAKHSEVAKVIANPQVSAEALYKFFSEVLISQLDERKSNFLKLVAQNKRLNILPAVHEFFSDLYSNYEKLSKVKITTAIEPQEAFLTEVKASLNKRIQREISLECEQDAAIIGGALFRIGDQVIDSSIRGKLQRLADSLLS